MLEVPGHVSMFTLGLAGPSLCPILKSQSRRRLSISNIQTIDKKVEPGISSFNNSIGGIKAYLDPLIAFAKSNIPEKMVEHSPIILYCTAGMRLLSLEQQESILSEVGNIFSESGFFFNKSSNWTRVISGVEEVPLLIL